MDTVLLLLILIVQILCAISRFFKGYLERQAAEAKKNENVLTEEQRNAIVEADQESARQFYAAVAGLNEFMTGKESRDVGRQEE